MIGSPVLACYERKLAGALSLTYYPSSKIGI